LYAGFTALSFVVCERLGALRGAAVTTVLLLFFGVDVYCIINYTKTAAVCTVGGTALLLYAFEKEGRHPAALVLGVLLAVMGFLLRSMEFLPCFALMAALFLRPLWGILESRESYSEKLKRFGRLAAPFALVLVISAAFYAVNEWAWSKEPWTKYHEFGKVRVAYSDYGRPAYAEMPEAYEGTCRLLRRTEDFTALLMLSDTTAMAAMKALEDHGKRIPQDVSVIAIDGLNVSEYAIPTLTTMIQPAEEMGSESVRILMNMLKDPGYTRHKLLNAPLREGASVRSI
jgi:hypothetical protein